MTDRIVLAGMEFEGRLGVSDEERAEPQTIELDVSLELDLREAGTGDDLTRTVDYADVFELCRAQVEGHSYQLLEALGEALAGQILARHALVETVVVTVRKPGAPIDGVLDHAAVQIERSRRA